MHTLSFTKFLYLRHLEPKMNLLLLKKSYRSMRDKFYRLLEKKFLLKSFKNLFIKNFKIP